MEVITTHQNTDFDGLASMVAAQKLYPNAQIIFSGSKEGNVREYLRLHPPFFKTRRLKGLDLEQIKQLIVVDTRQADRIGPFGRLLGQKSIQTIFYDHHPAGETDFKGDMVEYRELGATTTIILKHIRKSGIEITPEEATLFALGIYEDTGSLSYPSTKPEDAEMVAYLLRRGANLGTVTNFINRELSKEQLVVLNELMTSSKSYDINGVKVVIAKAATDRYVDDLAILTHKLRDMGNWNVVFTLVQLDTLIHLAARSKVEELDVGRVASAFGGGGHRTASSATIHGKAKLLEVEKELLEILKKYIKPVLRAKDIMSYPVIAIKHNSTIEEARRKIISHNHTGFPVVQNDELVGLITHKDIYKAIHHGLGEAKLIGYMNPDVISITPDTGLGELQKLMMDNRIKYLPVVKQNKLVGFITYADLLKTHHSPRQISAQPVIETEHSRYLKNIAPLLEKRISAKLLSLLKKIGKIADKMGFTAYTVGGFVRDAILGSENMDVDIVVEGLGVNFAQELASKLGGRCTPHKKFATAILVLDDGFKLDIATARTEFYEFPTALPTVELSSIRYDLYRRDFTINAQAVNLNPEHFGDLVDFFGGLQDIKQGIIKVLHNLSFVDDPTRIFRAVRFETRFGFKIDKQTEHFLDNALQLGVLEKITTHRVREELILVLSESNPWAGVQRLDQLKVLKRLHPKLNADHKMEHLFNKSREVLVWFELLYHDDSPCSWLIYFMALTHKLTASELSEFGEHIKLNKKHLAILNQLHKKNTLISRRLATTNEINDSEIYHLLHQIPLEILLHNMSMAKNELLRKRISRYLTDLKKVDIAVTGNDLKKFGVPPGPQFKALLLEVISQKLDGKVQSRDDELKLVSRLLANRKS